MKLSPPTILHLLPNEIFTFGSNESGIHGAGAARMAHKRFGAVWGTGVGPTGQCYAIPTKDARIDPLPLATIEGYVTKFLAYAQSHPNQTFLVTAIGCGLAGYSPQDIAPMFFPKGQTLYNVLLPQVFVDAMELKTPPDQIPSGP